MKTYSIQAKYGVGGDLPTMLVLVPSHVPQCVEIFNESNIGKKNVLEAFQTAAGLCKALEEERFKLDNRRSLIKAQDKEFLEQEEQSMPVKSSENTDEDHAAKTHRKDQSTSARCHSNEDCDVKARRIREDRQNRVPPEPKKGHFIILRFGDLKFQRKFKTTALFQEVYDWGGSIESLPLHFTLQRRQEVILHEHQLTEQEVLDVYEREQEDVKELLATQVSFRGNIPQAEEGKLSVTIVDETRKEKTRKERIKIRRKEKRASREQKREEGKASKKPLKKAKKENQEKKEEQERVEAEMQHTGFEASQQTKTSNVKKRKNDRRTGSQRKKLKQEQ